MEKERFESLAEASITAVASRVTTVPVVSGPINLFAPSFAFMIGFANPGSPFATNLPDSFILGFH